MRTSGIGLVRDGGRVVAAVPVGPAAEAVLRAAEWVAVASSGVLVPVAVGPRRRADGPSVGARLTAAVRDGVVPGAVEVEPRVRLGDPVQQLVAASEDADLLVVGDHARPFGHEGLGDVAAGCVRRARCPVLVVRPVERLHRRVVLGAGTASRAWAATAAAAAAARWSDGELLVVRARAWSIGSVLPLRSLPLLRSLDPVASAEAEVLAHLLALGQDQPRHRRGAAPAGSAASVLVRESASADLVVVGRSAGGSRARRRSTAVVVAARAACPVLVVPTDGVRTEPAEHRPVRRTAPGDVLGR